MYYFYLEDEATSEERRVFFENGAYRSGTARDATNVLDSNQRATPAGGTFSVPFVLRAGFDASSRFAKDASSRE